LRRVTRILTQHLDLELRRQGIRSTQTPILRALYQKEVWSMAEMSDWLGMDRTTLVRNLRPLERDGLLKLVGGGRGHPVELTITPKGRKQVEQYMPAWQTTQGEIVKTLGAERWAAILNDLELAANTLRK
jgi:DNA-binding MarR family transcriptional regulator